MKNTPTFQMESFLDSGEDAATLYLSTDPHRGIQFQGIFRKGIFAFHLAMKAFATTIRKSDRFTPVAPVPDPFVTITPEKILFEGVRGEGDLYAAVMVDSRLLENKKQPFYGTSPFHFPARMDWGIESLRSSRRTTFNIGPTADNPLEPFQDKPIETSHPLSDSAFRIFQEIQESMGSPGPRLEIPISTMLQLQGDLKLADSRNPPRGFRFENGNSHGPSLVIEPWEKSYPVLNQTEENPQQPIRVNQDLTLLSLLNPLIPYANSIHLEIRTDNRPHFWWVQLGGVTFVLGLANTKALATPQYQLLRKRNPKQNWTPNQWTQAQRQLETQEQLTAESLAQSLGLKEEQSIGILQKLCHDGHAFFDFEESVYRHRELYESSNAPEKTADGSEEVDRAVQIYESGQISIHCCFPVENPRKKPFSVPGHPNRYRLRIEREWHIHGKAGDIPDVRVVVDDLGNLVSGLCDCPFFENNLIKNGPCQHMGALLLATVEQRSLLSKSAPFGGNRGDDP